MFSTLRKRARHPIRSITEPFGKAGLTVAICALVLAMVGGAYAAGGLTKPQEKQVKKIAKKYAGKPGTPGTNGTNGTPGEKGAPGVPGAPGESVKLAAASGCGVPGGTKLTVGAESKEVCNGKEGLEGEKGEEGKEGSPWTELGNLPSEKTETGTWGFVGETPEGYVVVPVSFTLPLEEALLQSQIHLIEVGQSGGSECPGSDVEPKAAKGQLCLYVDHAVGLTNAALVVGVSRKSGVILEFQATAAGGAAGAGTWAVTAP